MKDIWNYAAAELELRPIRAEHKEKIEELLEDNVSSGSICYTKNMKPSLQRICNSYKIAVMRITQKYGVYQDFTLITNRIRLDPKIRQKYDKALECQKRGKTYEQCY